MTCACLCIKVYGPAVSRGRRVLDGLRSLRREQKSLRSEGIDTIDLLHFSLSYVRTYQVVNLGEPGSDKVELKGEVRFLNMLRESKHVIKLLDYEHQVNETMGKTCREKKPRIPETFSDL